MGQLKPKTGDCITHEECLKTHQTECRKAQGSENFDWNTF